jgi:hypothetical protein
MRSVSPPGFLDEARVDEWQALDMSTPPLSGRDALALMARATSTPV